MEGTMDKIKSLKRPNLEDCYRIIDALTRFPYFGAIMSLVSAFYDLYDLASSLFKKNVIQRAAVVKAALSRFLAHTITGLAGLNPFVTIAAFMFLHPCLLPLVALLPVIAELYKYCKIVNATKKEVERKSLIFKQNPTADTLKDLKESREILYQAKQERAISGALVVSATLSLFGIIFPPLLLAGLVISVSVAMLGFLDKRYRFSERISHYIFGNPDNGEEEIIENNYSIVPLQPISMNKALMHHEQEPSIKKQISPAKDKKEAEIKPRIKPQQNASQQGHTRFFNSKPAALSTAVPILMAMDHLRL
jgi:hypothetical protein